MDWLVLVDTGAYERWVNRYSPSPRREVDMLGWIDGLQWEGPPPLIEHPDDPGPAGLRVAEGPNGERVVCQMIPYLSADAPPAGQIVIREILDQPTADPA